MCFSVERWYRLKLFCYHDEIGKHRGLKIPRGNSLEGSSPSGSKGFVNLLNYSQVIIVVFEEKEN